MKIISWNINGLNASIKKGLLDIIREIDADVYCFQEVKVSREKVDKTIAELDEYYKYWNFAEKRGYSGTLTLSRLEPESVFYGIDQKGFDKEGRTITLEFPQFYLINCYFPNASRGLVRLDFKLDFNARILRYIERMRKKKGVVLTGDLNVVHKDIDIHWERPMRDDSDAAGTTLKERLWFDRFLARGYIDTFREFTSEGGYYTYWDTPSRARERNKGWRLDYFVISKELKSHVIESTILSEIYGSDHCPISLITDY
ncbi:MAG: exodeoxyribonuclease III [Candidatus Thorarchaeota archaeon]